MTFSNTVTRLVQDFFRVLIGRRDVSPNTISAYRDALRILLSFAASRIHQSAVEITLDDLGRETVLAFLEHLEQGRCNSASTRNARLAAVHSFFQFVAQEDATSVDVC